MSNSYENELHILKLWESGVTNDQTIAYHGTSFEAIRVALENGNIPGYTRTDIQYNEPMSQKGDLYFLPRFTHFPFELLPEVAREIDFKQPDYTLEDTYKMATTPASIHRFLNLLQLPIPRFYGVALDLIDSLGTNNLDERNSLPILLDKGYTIDQIKSAHIAAHKRKGLVIGLKIEALRDYPFTQGDAGDDFRIRTGTNGIPLDYFSGLEPNGPWERLYLLKLAHRHGVLDQFVDKKPLTMPSRIAA